MILKRGREYKVTWAEVGSEATGLGVERGRFYVERPQAEARYLAEIE